MLLCLCVDGCGSCHVCYLQAWLPRQHPPLLLTRRMLSGFVANPHVSITHRRAGHQHAPNEPKPAQPATLAPGSLVCCCCSCCPPAAAVYLEADAGVRQIDAPQSCPDHIVLQPGDQVGGAVRPERSSKLVTHRPAGQAGQAVQAGSTGGQAGRTDRTGGRVGRHGPRASHSSKGRLCGCC